MIGMGGGVRGRSSAWLAILVIASAAVAALIWLGFMAATGGYRTTYARVQVSPTQTTWVEFGGGRMRMAPSATALGKAKWVEPVEQEWGHVSLPDVTLPLAGEKSQDWDKVQAAFEGYGRNWEARWQLGLRDEDGSEWTYTVKSNLRTGRSRERSPVATPPSPEPLTMGVTTDWKNDQGKPAVAVAAQVALGPYELEDIKKARKSVEAQVRVIDENGKVVGTTKAPLKDLGFT
jgi:hypothetical protein